MLSSKGLFDTERATQNNKIPTLSLITIRAIPLRQNIIAVYIQPVLVNEVNFQVLYSNLSSENKTKNQERYSLCYVAEHLDMSLQFSPVRKLTDIHARSPTLKRLANKQTVIPGGTHNFILEKLTTNFHRNYNRWCKQSHVQTRKYEL